MPLPLILNEVPLNMVIKSPKVFTNSPIYAFLQKCNLLLAQLYLKM